jgi:hypothetical protein
MTIQIKKPNTRPIRAAIKESSLLSRFYRDEAKRLFERARNSTKPDSQYRLRQEALAFREKSDRLSSDQHHRFAALAFLTGRAFSPHKLNATTLAPLLFTSGLFSTKDEAAVAAQKCIDGFTIIDITTNIEKIAKLSKAHEVIRTLEDSLAAHNRFLDKSQKQVAQANHDIATTEKQIAKTSAQLIDAKLLLQDLQREDAGGSPLTSGESTAATAA